jgi:hypothetical protein
VHLHCWLNQVASPNKQGSRADRESIFSDRLVCGMDGRRGQAAARSGVQAGPALQGVLKLQLVWQERVGGTHMPAGRWLLLDIEGDVP